MKYLLIIMILLFSASLKMFADTVDSCMPACFLADPETAKSHSYWGNGYMADAKLNDDMLSVKSETITVITPEGGTSTQTVRSW